MVVPMERTRRSRVTQLLRRQSLLRADGGATAVEFALVAAPFIALLVAILQTMVVFFAQRLLDEVVSQASRTILTGQAQTSGLTQSQFTSWVCQKTVILFTCANYMVNVTSYSSFSAASTATPTLTFDSSGNVSNTWNYSLGSPGDIVVVQVLYQWPIILGPLGFNLSNLANGNRLLVSSNVFKREPY
ncbi:MAG: pilus assembly protein [Bradyrhizobium sp.]|nr:pilus assembly protein [Bradyrhizobium sp.]MBV8916474.1 pilus assembly protein [Bradyrhizobium sp.]